MKKNAIIIDGNEFDFIPEKNEKKECCWELCDLKDVCFSKLKSDNMICNIHKDKNKGIVNGYYVLVK